MLLLLLLLLLQLKYLCFSHNASLVVKNNKGQTARDLAISTNNDMAVRCLTSSMGQSQLEKMSRPGKSSSKSSRLNLFWFCIFWEFSTTRCSMATTVKTPCSDLIYTNTYSFPYWYCPCLLSSASTSKQPFCSSSLAFDFFRNFDFLGLEFLLCSVHRCVFYYSFDRVNNS